LRFNKDLKLCALCVLCGEIHSKPYSDEDYDPIFSIAEVPVDGIDPLVRYCTLSFSERNVSPMCSLVLDVHVKQHEMHMSYCPTCTCRTALHVHLKQRYTRRLHTLLYKIELYQYRRKRLIAMTNTIKFKTE
ncbi:hypothetical protein, partial [Bacteroides nordii]|uniref:hypothetical protein n=1 Tax=Bacteroides nordii TaxID=291645 RepID=UPI0021E677F5